MAGSADDALALAAAYRTQQLAVRAAVVRDAVALWPVLDKMNVGGTSPDWLRLLRALVQRWWTASATLALDFYPKTRADIAGAPHLTLPPALPDETILRNLLYSGPGEIKRAAARGLTPPQADRSALASSAQSAARLALQGGRDTIDLAIERDPEALGWMRVTDGDPCHFCAMLVGRGAVYKTAASAGADPRDLYGDAAPVSHWHDSCGCTVVPVFTTKPALTREAKHFDALWVSSTAGLSGADARNAFRRAVEGR